MHWATRALPSACWAADNWAATGPSSAEAAAASSSPVRPHRYATAASLRPPQRPGRRPCAPQRLRRGHCRQDVWSHRRWSSASPTGGWRHSTQARRDGGRPRSPPGRTNQSPYTVLPRVSPPPRSAPMAARSRLCRVYPVGAVRNARTSGATTSRAATHSRFPAAAGGKGSRGSVHVAPRNGPIVSPRVVARSVGVTKPKLRERVDRIF